MAEPKTDPKTEAKVKEVPNPDKAQPAAPVPESETKQKFWADLGVRLEGDGKVPVPIKR